VVHFGPARVGHFRPASYGHFNPARVVYYVRRFHISVAQTYYNDSFSGIVSKKFIDWDNHGYKKIVLVNQSKTREVRLDYEWIGLFKFIEVGDSISKEKNNLDMRLRRKELDTIIRLNFSGIKNSWDYIDFLYELDSIYDK